MGSSGELRVAGDRTLPIADRRNRPVDARAQHDRCLEQHQYAHRRARGLSERHPARAGMPSSRLLGPVIANIITGSVVIEQIFSIPGIGRYFRRAPSIATTRWSGSRFYGALIILCNLGRPRLRVPGSQSPIQRCAMSDIAVTPARFAGNQGAAASGPMPAAASCTTGPRWSAL